jgi:HEAT repeat protein
VDPRRSFLLASLVLVAACSGSSGPGTTRADEVFDALVEENHEYAEYAFSLLGGGEGDAFATRRIHAALESGNVGRIRLALIAVDGMPSGASLDEKTKSALRTVFEGQAGTLKLQAAIALAREGDTAALDWLRAEAEGSGNVSVAALEVLAGHGEAQLVGPLIKKRMDSDQLGVRNEAYALLGEIGEPWSTRMLVEGLGHEFGEERAQAVASLGRTGDPSVASHVEKLVSYQGLVLPAIEALGALGNPTSVKVVKPMLKHEQPLVRVYAGVALLRLGEAEAAAAALDPLVADPDPLVRGRLAEQLAAVSDPRAIDWLARLAGDEDPEVRAAAARSLVAQAERGTRGLQTAFLTLAEDPDYRVATVALDGLARIGDSQALPAVEALVENENPYVALSAARAAGAIHGRA